MSTCSFCKSIGKHWLYYCSHEDTNCDEIKSCVFLFCREGGDSGFCCEFSPFDKEKETFKEWKDKHIAFHQVEEPCSKFHTEFPKYLERVKEIYQERNV